jgi:hypothetical protein
MSKDRYSFSSDVKNIAFKKAREFISKPNSVHHICPRSLAKKYNLKREFIVKEENAIALEQDFHDAIHHGGKYFDQEFKEWVEIEAFNEEDYIYLAIALLGLSESDFDEGNVRQSRSNRSRKKKNSRRKSRHHRH